MAQVSIGQVENLEDLVSGLESVREALDTACREQIAVAVQNYDEVCEEGLNSTGMLQNAVLHEQTAEQNINRAGQVFEESHASLSSAQSALSSCLEQSYDDDERCPDCLGDYFGVAEAEAMVEHAQSLLEQARAELYVSTAKRICMEQRFDLAKQAQGLATCALEQVQQECNAHIATIEQAIALGVTRLNSAQRALDAYFSINPSSAQFYVWLKWDPAKSGRPVTPDILRDRLNLSSEQRRFLQEYLYDCNPAYRRQVDKYRNQWGTAKGDTERNIVARKARIHLSGEFGEQMVRHALAPLGGQIETQGRTFVGDNGRYTKTDLLVTNLRVPVILGRSDGMGAPVGGSMAFEVKCGKAEYLYYQKDHMTF
ncbi:hypothetical protein [Acetobacter persici]|uniref:Uncharacterized protein n=1 Tax=Acetobacter persici TaxID=1076596 RepID=A0A6V8IAQ8_9PROT|nr:hypothetical protein [Acetobacter persici]GFE94708.1 hypothetical protein DmAi_27670 [Acetobacter persici]